MSRSSRGVDSCISGLDRNHCLVPSSQTFYPGSTSSSRHCLETVSLPPFIISLFPSFLNTLPIFPRIRILAMNLGIPLQNKRIWKILESFEGHPFSVHLEIKCRSPFQFCSLAQPCLSFHFRKTGGSRAALVFIIIRADAPP